MLYEPAEDSYLLLEQVKKYAKGKVLDLGTGTGILAEAALERTKDVLAADINEEAVNFVKKKGIKAVRSDLFSNIKGRFDLIIFNPPYLPKEVREPDDSALSTTGGKKGSEIIERFLCEAKEHLEKDGKILMIFSSLTPNVDKLIKKYNYKHKKLSEKSFFFEKLYVYLIENSGRENILGYKALFF